MNCLSCSDTVASKDQGSSQNELKHKLGDITVISLQKSGVTSIGWLAYQARCVITEITREEWGHLNRVASLPGQECEY